MLFQKIVVISVLSIKDHEKLSERGEPTLTAHEKYQRIIYGIFFLECKNVFILLYAYILFHTYEFGS